MVMAAMTRMRCGPDGVPGKLQQEYYSQRASSGFMLTECSFISDNGNSYLGAAGISNKQ